ncbi:MAG TPA: hypothetical protein VF753_02565 [Terriglobales bacterium]
MSREKESLPRKIRTGILFAVLMPLIIPLGLLALVMFWLHRFTLYLLVWSLWLPKGKDILVVYSDSTIWREYMVDHVIPLVEERAIILNWSERKRWRKRSLSHKVFFSFGAGREYNPLVILFRPFSRAKIFRFYGPFQNWKRGYTEPVERLRQELTAAL